MKRILVTGAAGYIGRHTLAPLIKAGFEVHGVTSRHGHAPFSQCKWHQVNLLDLARIKKLLQTVRPTHLLHLAWDVTPGEYWTSTGNFAWVQAGLELLQRFQEQGGTRVVMAGTCAEYDLNYGFCSEFSTPKAPSSPYGICKFSLQRMVDAYSATTGISSAWGRVFFNYGPDEHPARLVSSVICSLLRGEPARCTHGEQIRDYLFIQDVADALVALLESNVCGPVNIASGKPVSLMDLISAISLLTGQPELVQLGSIDSPVNEPKVVLADVQRLIREVGWVPKYSLARGLELTVNWWRNYLRSQNEQKK